VIGACSGVCRILLHFVLIFTVILLYIVIFVIFGCYICLLYLLYEDNKMYINDNLYGIYINSIPLKTIFQ
jgi:hypothetical protein